MEEKEIKNSVKGVEFSWERKIGNSTRQIDAAIQYFFQGYKVVIRDHYMQGENRKANELLFHRVISRLRMEHELAVGKQIGIDKDKLTIERL